MVFFNCDICSNIFKNPIECTNCHTNFCKAHLNSSNECPNCRKKSNYFKNGWLLNNLKLYEIEEKKKKSLIKKCSLCDFEGEKDSFWVHLIEVHKSIIIDNFSINTGNIIQNVKDINDKNIYTLQKFEIKECNNFTPIKLNEIDNLQKSFISQNNNSLTNFINLNVKHLRNSSTQHRNLKKNISLNKNNNENKIIKYINNKKRSLLSNSEKKRKKYSIYTEKLIHIIFEKTLPTKSGEILYCGMKNEIECDCCADHIVIAFA